MLNTATLRDVLKEIFGVEDKYLLPLTDDQFVPTLDPKDKIGTWIGYMMLYKEPYARGFQAEPNAYMPISTKFRITFVGPQAEEFADSTLFWDMRTDVINAFERAETQLNYMQRQVYTYPVQNKGFNDRLCWIVDMKAQTVIELDMNHGPWFPDLWKPT